jgi:hypothetical protein
MLSERIDAVASDMPPEIRRWFIEPDYAKPSIQHQDWDLILADWDYLPLLIEYCEDLVHPLEKRFEAFSALMVLQGSCPSGAGYEQKKSISQEIERIVLGNRDFARRVCDQCLGLIEALIIKKMLGEEIPNDVPEWMRKEIENRA